MNNLWKDLLKYCLLFSMYDVMVKYQKSWLVHQYIFCPFFRSKTGAGDVKVQKYPFNIGRDLLQFSEAIIPLHLGLKMSIFSVSGFVKRSYATRKWLLVDV